MLALAPVGLATKHETATPKEPQEVVSLRTARSETFVDEDGTYHTNTYTRSINYKRAGTWRPIDNRLVQSDRKGFRYRNAANSFHVDFKESLDNGFMRFETPRGKAAIEVSLEKSDDVAVLKRSSSGLSYRGVRKKTDIRYDVTADGVKETVVLHDAGAPSSYVFDIRPEEGQDLRAAKQRDGSIRFFAEGDDEPAFSLAAPTVADSDEAGAPNSPAPEMTWMEIAKRDDGSFRLVVSIDPKWLKDPARVFPVYLDPNYNIYTQQDAYYITKIDGAPQDSPPVTSAISLNVGHDFQGSPYYGYKNYIFKSVARFDLSSIPIGSNVTAVTPSLYLDGCLYPSNCSSSSHVGTVQMRRLTTNWLPAQSWGQVHYDGTILASRYFNSASDQVLNRYQLTPSGDGLRWAVNEMVSDRMSNYGFLFEKDSESGNGFTFASSRRSSTLAPMLSISWLPTGVVMPGGTSASQLSVHANGAELSWSVWGGVYPSAIAADAPAVYYRLNEASGTSAFDSSGREKTGTYVNTTLNQVGAVPGGDKAASFNGTNSYTITPSMLNPMSSGGKSETIEVWFKPNGAGVIVDELGSTSLNSGWHDSALEILPNGEVMVRVWNVSPVSLGTASFGAWHHAVLRYNETNNTLDGYLDGKKYQGTVGARAVPWEYGYNLHFALGATDTTKIGSGAYFSGSLDEFAVFPQALTDERIRAHFKAGVYQRYEIHRSRTNDFAPSASTLVGTINDPGLTTYRDTTAAASSTFYYKIVAQTAAGPSISNQVVAALPAWNAQTDDPKDKPIGPQVAISSPAPGSQLKGLVTIKAGASDDGKIASVQFKANGVNLGSADTSAPYEVSKDSNTVPRGSYTLTAVATDDAGNTTTSSAVAVTVNNSNAPTVSVSAASETSPNLIINDSFGENLDGWDSWKADLNRSNDVSRSVGWSAKVTSAENGSGFGGSYGAELSGSTAGRTFAVSAWVYVPSGSDLIGSDIYAIARAVGGSAPEFEESGDCTQLKEGWQQIRATHTISESDRTGIELHAEVDWGGASGVFFYLDNAEIHELSTNLIDNDSFETNLDGWDSWQADLSRSSDLSKSGSWSAAVTSTVDGGFSASYAVGLDGSTAGRTFTVSAWVYFPSDSDLIGKDVYAVARAWGGSNSDTEEGRTRYEIQAGWQQISTTHTIQEGDRSAICLIAYPEWGGTASDVFYLDNAELREVSNNLITNDGFEENLDGWDSWNAGLGRSNEVSKSADWSAEVTSTEGGGFSAVNAVALDGPTAGRTFTVSAWVYFPAESDLIGKEVCALARARGGAAPEWEEGRSNYEIREGWQQISATHTLEENDRTVIELHAYVTWGSTASDHFYLDNAEMHEVGKVSVAANPLDDYGVDHVDFLVDGKRFASANAAPWTATLNTVSFPVYNGPHQITARAFDGDGNSTTSIAQQITVANSSGSEYQGSIAAANVPSEMSFDPRSNPTAGSPERGPYGTPLLDDFNRADGAPGTNWSDFWWYSQPVISGNEIDFNHEWKGMRWNAGGLVEPAAEAWMKVDGLWGAQKLALRANADGEGHYSFYEVALWDNGGGQIVKVVDSDEIEIGDGFESGTFEAGDYLAVSAVGDAIEVWRWASGGTRWTLVTSVTDSEITGQGSIAVMGMSTIDDFGGGSIDLDRTTSVPLDVSLHNTSGETWSESSVKLRYRWLNSDGSVFSTSGSFSIGGDLADDESRDDVSVSVNPPELPASVMRGRFTLRIDLYDTATDTYFSAKGNAPFEKTVTVTRVQPDELGLERYQQYDGTDLGSNFGASVNLTNGNLVVESTLSRQPGVGLDTVAELNYNSLEQGSVSPVGNNWSLAISGLTPFGLPLDIHPNAADNAAGRTEKWIGLTDGDGTYHRFTLNTGGHFYDAPPGVHLYARKLYIDGSFAGYAFTKPDRTTFYFNIDGYPTRVEDKNGNEITFTQVLIPDGNDANGLTKKITAVTDEKGRTYDIGYFDPSNPNLDPSNTSRSSLWGKVSYIEDHNDHKFVFAYYDDGNLMSVTEKGGQNADGSYLADRSVVFTYTTKDGSGAAIETLAARRNPPSSTEQSTRLYSVIDARGNETSFSYFGPGAKQWRVSRVTNRRGDESSAYVYDLANSKTSVTQPPGRMWSYTFDAEGRLTSFDDPITRQLGKATRVEWSPDNNVSKVTEPTGEFVRYEYNDNGYQTKAVDELGNETTTHFQDLPLDEYDTTKHISRIDWTIKPQGNAPNGVPGGYKWTFDYTNTTTDDVWHITAPGGAVTTNTYNTNGTLASQIQPAAGDGITRTTTYNTYDENGLPTKVTDPALNVSYAEYDAAGNLRWQQDPNHQSYSGGDPAQYQTRYYYDSYGRVGRTSTPKSTSLYPGLLIWEDTRYDANDNVLEDWNAHYGAGDSGFAPSVTTEYDVLDQPTLVTSQRGSKTQTFYDEAGRVRRVVAPNGYGQSQYFSETVTSYDLLDRPYQVTEYASGQDARTTTYCYDLAGDLRSSTAPLGSTLGMACPAIGTGAYTPTSAGYTTKFYYDAAHRQVKQTAPGNASTRVEYDANGQAVKSWDENGNLTETTYDGRGLPTKTVEPFDGARKITTLTEYDPLGRVKREISPRAFDTGGPSGPYTYYVTGYSYDALSRKTMTTLPIGPGEPQRYIHQSYDAIGNQTMISLPTAASSARSTSPLDKTVTSYLDTGSIYSTLDGSSGYTDRYDYTAEGWQSTRWPEIANAAGSIELSKAIHWDYKPDGPLAVVRDPQGQRETYSYDPSGNEIQAREASGGSEILIERTFNGFNELTQVRTPDSTYPGFVRDTRYTYDRNGNTLSELVNDGELGSGRTFNYEYDQRDQVISQTDDFATPASAGDDEKLTYAYTSAGQLSSRSLFKWTGSSWAPEHEARTTYYENGLTKQLSNYVGGSGTPVEEHSLSYTYDVYINGNYKNVYFNGNKVNDTFRIVGPDPSAICRTSTCTSFWQYDGQDRLTYEYSGDGSHGDPTLYTLDAAGNVTFQRTGSQTTTSTYVGQRLVKQTGPDGDPYRFIYDVQGNLACKVYESSWDFNVCPTVGKMYLESYTYDYKNRLTAYARYGVHSDLKEQTSYTLDSLDRTVSKTETYVPNEGAPQSEWETTTTTTTYDGDSSRVVEERLTGSPGKKTYAYDAFGETITFSDSTAVGQYQPAARYSYLYDPGSSVSLVVDSQGQVKESYGYSAYGSPNNAITKSATDFQAGNVPTNPVRFQGKRFDSGSGSYDMGARRYSAQTGRWLQQDMYYDALDNLGLSQDPLTANRYAFLGANPINYVEFDGHQAGPMGPQKGPVGCSSHHLRCRVKHQARGIYNGLRDAGSALWEWRHPVKAGKTTYEAGRHPRRTWDAFEAAVEYQREQGGEDQADGYIFASVVSVYVGAKVVKAGGVRIAAAAKFLKKLAPLGVRGPVGGSLSRIDRLKTNDTFLKSIRALDAANTAGKYAPGSRVVQNLLRAFGAARELGFSLEKTLRAIMKAGRRAGYRDRNIMGPPR